MAELCDVVLEVMGKFYPYLYENINLVKEMITKDETKFLQTLSNGEARLADMLTTCGEVLDGKSAFQLYDTYGFPIELTEELAAEKNLKVDIIYICSPNNPTGAVYNKEQLKSWVDFANKNQALILFDSAYECFVSDPELPRSIFEIDGAKTCAIEICSLSKTAGFTGTRCGYTIVPKDLGNLNKMWLRRQTTKYNGVPYIVQRGAEAVFTEEGMSEIAENLNYYKENAKIISQTMEDCNIWYVGGKHSPYIWLKCPNNMSSWEFFDYLLEKAQVVGTPGAGFGKNGEGYFRLTSFGSRENTIEAMERFKKLFK